MPSPTPWTTYPPERLRGGAVSIGNFDGVHMGHAALIRKLRQRAEGVGGPAVVLTFDPHPLQLLRPDDFLPVLTSLEDRVSLLHERGADGVWVLQTTPELLHLTAEQFFAEVLVQRLQARAVVEGENFRFGHLRTGDMALMTELCRQRGMTADVVPAIQVDGQTVSSSRVRAALERGAVCEAGKLLQRSYRLRGVVGTGARRGRQIGFPTANLMQPHSLVPANGVYAVRVHIHGRSWPGAANIGPNPTFGEQTRKLEVHLIGFSGDLVGETLAVDFLDRLRATRPFAGVAELVEQIRRDVEDARRIAEGENT